MSRRQFWAIWFSIWAISNRLVLQWTNSPALATLAGVLGIGCCLAAGYNAWFYFKERG